MEVNNRDTSLLMGRVQSLKQQIRELNGAIKDLINLNDKIGKKSEIVDKILKENANEKTVRRANDRDAKLELIKQKIDFRDVEDIFDDVIAEELKGGVVLSLVNFSMVCVIAVSGYLWFKLNKVDGI